MKSCFPRALALVRSNEMSALDFATLLRFSNIASILKNSGDFAFKEVVDKDGKLSEALLERLPQRLSLIEDREKFIKTRVVTPYAFARHTLELQSYLPETTLLYTRHDCVF